MVKKKVEIFVEILIVFLLLINCDLKTSNDLKVLKELGMYDRKLSSNEIKDLVVNTSGLSWKIKNVNYENPYYIEFNGNKFIVIQDNLQERGVTNFIILQYLDNTYSVVVKEQIIEKFYFDATGFIILETKYRGVATGIAWSSYIIYNENYEKVWSELKESDEYDDREGILYKLRSNIRLHSDRELSYEVHNTVIENDKVISYENKTLRYVYDVDTRSYIKKDN